METFLTDAIGIEHTEFGVSVWSRLDID